MRRNRPPEMSSPIMPIANGQLLRIEEPASVLHAQRVAQFHFGQQREWE